MGWDTIPVWHMETRLPEHTELVFVPGGFSYGDYLRCGAIRRWRPSWGTSGAMPTMAAWCWGLQRLPDPMRAQMSPRLVAQ